MKQTTLVVSLLIGALIACLTYSSAFAENSLILTATASSVYNNSASYDAAKAVDGNISTYWAGAVKQASWWIMVDAGKVTYISKIILKWTATSYMPTIYSIQTSSDGTAWEDVYTNIAGKYSQTGEVRSINRKAKYVKLVITQMPTPYCPRLKEFEAYETVPVPHVMRFQGSLEDIGGLPLEGAFALTFGIYDVAAGSTSLWEETLQNVYIEEGSLDVELGTVTPLDLPFDKQYWLGVKVGSDSEMAPRFKLVTVPYSFKAE